MIIRIAQTLFHRSRLTAVVSGGVSVVTALCGALSPEIAHIYPDYPGVSPHILTGENFEPGNTEV
jgi:hypothetical protein